MNANVKPTPVTRAERVLVLGGLALALLATPAVLVLPGPWIGAVWGLALLRAAVAGAPRGVLGAGAGSLGHALWLALVHGDRSRFGAPCGASERVRQDTLSWSTRTGAYAYLRIRDRNEALTRGVRQFAD